MQLAKAGHRTTVLDVDLGGGNLHTYLGVRPSELTLGDFILGRVADLSEVRVPTSLPNLKIICGPQDYYPFSNLLFTQKVKILRNIFKLEDEFIILDLGPGSAYNVIDFSLISNGWILVLHPEPSSVENGYLYMKRLIHRRIHHIVRHSGQEKLLAQWTAGLEGNENRKEYIVEFLSSLREIESCLADKIEAAISRISIKIVLNQVRAQDDVRMGKAISYFAKQYLGIKADFIGFIPFDETVTMASRNFQPFTVFYPESRAAKGLSYLSKRLVG
jgi:flagellar biosynthesis protein FlhG